MYKVCTYVISTVCNTLQFTFVLSLVSRKSFFMVKVMLYSGAGKRGLRVRFFRRNKYAASLLSEVTNTAKTQIQGSFRAFYMGEKRRKCTLKNFHLPASLQYQ